MRKLLTALLLGATFAGAAAQTPPPGGTAPPQPTSPASDKKRNLLPDPFIAMDSESVAWAYIQARPDDRGFQSLLRTAWQGIRTNPPSSAAWLGIISTFMSSSKQEDVLLGLLPFQGVRVDRLDKLGQDHSVTMATLSGWPGVQAMFWNSLLTGPDGRAYTTQQIGSETLVLRPKPGQQPHEGPAVARMKGSFFAFSDPEMGRRMLSSKGPSGEAYEIASQLDRSQDTLGVLLNRKDSILRFFEWLDAYDLHIIEEAIGAPVLKEKMTKVRYATWTGDLVDDDRMELEVKFHANSEEDAEEVGEMLQSARRALKAKGRAAELQMTTVRSDIIVRVEMVGYRRILQAYLKRPR